MGWDWSYKPDGENLKSFVTRKLKSNYGVEPLAVSIYGQTIYTAVKNPKTESVFGLVILTRHDKTSVYNTGLKLIAEDMGPYHTECPQYIIKMLSPTTDRLSLEWRKACTYKKQPNYSKENTNE